MKNLVCGAAIAVFSIPLFLHAQGTIYFSSMGTPSQGSLLVGSNSWGAAWFQTGNSAGGYSLNSIQLLMGNSVGSPSGFSVMLWDFQTDQPILTLTGPNPTAAGVYSYTTSSFLMPPSQVYWLVVTSQTSVGAGAFNWSYSSLHALGNPWSGGGYNVSSDGLNWIRDPDREFQFSVYASQIPEPSSLALCLTAGIIAAHRFIRRRKIQAGHLH